jgi:SAM-dependent methyltransferase
MPTNKPRIFVFGKGRTKGKRARIARKALIDHGLVGQTLFHRRREQLGHRDPWCSESNTLRRVERNFGVSLIKTVKQKLKRKKKLTVVSWGCGKGIADTGLAKRFGSKIRVYGFSDMAYKEWLKNNKVYFIHSSQEQFGRYFKDNSIDLLYSHKGLLHVSPLIPYFESLLPKLKKQGILIFDAPFEILPRGFQTKTINGMVFEIGVNPWYYSQGDYKKIYHHDVVIARRIK